MGRTVAELADHLILTTSRFRGAPAIPALARQLAGARSVIDRSPQIVLNRREAIRRAVLAARPDDVVLIPGRGAFAQMQPDPRGRAIPFDDRRVALEILREALGEPTTRRPRRELRGRRKVNR